MDARELLLQAADHIERYGKIEGQWVPSGAIDLHGSTDLRTAECPACVGGALAIVISGHRTYSPNFVHQPFEKKTMEEAIERLVSSLGLQASDHLSRYRPLDWIIKWSDKSTQADVVAGLRKAAG